MDTQSKGVVYTTKDNDQSRRGTKPKEAASTTKGSGPESRQWTHNQRECVLSTTSDSDQSEQGTQNQRKCFLGTTRDNDQDLNRGRKTRGNDKQNQR
jgi:hypothetical protein